MPRGGATQTKVHYKGKENDYIVFVDDVKSYEAWKSDSSIPLAQVVAGFEIFGTDKHGAQGVLGQASKQELDTEFGTTNEDEVIKTILQKGSVQATEGAERQGPKNDSKGPMVAH